MRANHGQIAVAGSLMRALAIAEEVEEQAAVYWGALAVGGPQLLTEPHFTRRAQEAASAIQARGPCDPLATIVAHCQRLIDGPPSAVPVE